MSVLDRWLNQCADLQARIGYQFDHEAVLMEAMTHSSYANEWRHKKLMDNERLEFLGDSILGLIVSHYIFDKYRHLPEGELTKIRANVVCESSLALKARRIQIGKHLLLGKGEEASGGRDRDSILADSLESLIAAIYLDGGYRRARDFVINNFEDLIDMAVNGNLMSDYKTKLQEILQSNHQEKIEYIVVNEEGPDHNKTFFVEVKLGERVMGAGEGKNKKEAEQSAAKKALINLDARV